MDKEQTFLDYLRAAVEQARQAGIQAFINLQMTEKQLEIVQEQLQYEEERQSTLRRNQE